jgi:hypothetical protein
MAKIIKRPDDQPSLPGFKSDVQSHTYFFDSSLLNYFQRFKDSISIFNVEEMESYLVNEPHNRFSHSLGVSEILKFLLALEHENKLQKYGEVLDTHTTQLNLLSSMLGRMYRDKELTVEDHEVTISSLTERKLEALKEANICLKEIINDYKNMEARLNHIMKLKEITRNIWLIARESKDKYLKQIAMMLHDSLRPVYAENINEFQLDGIEAILNVMGKNVIDINDARIVDDILTKIEMEYIPEVKEETKLTMVE